MRVHQATRLNDVSTGIAAGLQMRGDGQIQAGIRVNQRILQENGVMRTEQLID